MKNNSNLVLTIVVVLGFMFFWDTFVLKRYAPANPPPSASQASAAFPAGNSSAAPAGLVPPSPARPSTEAAIQTDNVKVTFQSLGARVTSWKIREKDHWVELVSPRPEAISSPLETAPGTDFTVQSQSPSEIDFSGVLPSGCVVNKKLALSQTSPFDELSIGVSNPTDQDQNVDFDLSWGEGLDRQVVGEEVDKRLASAVAVEMRALGYAGRLHSWRPGFISSRSIDQMETGPFHWVGVDNYHFLAAIIPVAGDIPEVRVIADRQTHPIVMVPFHFVLKAGQTQEARYWLYVGPKQYDALVALDHGLAEAVDFGFFGPISKLLLKALQILKRMTGNFGWAIVVLTIILQVLMYPLTKKNLSHSVRMRELQPQLKKLQEQFKTDPKRLQIETMNVYRKNGLRFMGMEGCVPVLLQIPVTFALYKTLRITYELRGAHFFWIKDLAVQDPIYVLPVLMGASMFVQQKLTAVAVDPAQANMMLMMPVVMTVMFIKFPAGLALYWCVNSVMTILVQRMIALQMAQKPRTV
jgi:YidC/Oxa1 family membrane protein insertase